ncbi:esterase [bacterium]|nr:MAG: esterase [bacterium]
MQRKMMALAVSMCLFLAPRAFGQSDAQSGTSSADSSLETLNISSKPNLPRGKSMPYLPGDYRESITVDGMVRTYLLHIPYAYNARKDYPLVLGFHGGGGTGAKFAQQTDFRVYADKEGFIAVFPDGIEHNWNDGRDSTDAYELGVNDVKFVRILVEHLKSKLRIDAFRVYAAGVSNGGFFSHRLGCEAADIFTAIGVDVAAMPTNMVSKCNPVKPVSLVAIQGTVDPFIPINGGDTKHKTLGIGDGGLTESAWRTMELWASKNGCRARPVITKLPARVHDGTSVTGYEYKNCRGDSAMNYYIVDGMGHNWPPNEPGREKERIVGPTSKNIDATKVFWEFFEHLQKRNKYYNPPREHVPRIRRTY